MVRAKFMITRNEEDPHNPGGFIIAASAVISGSEENEKFFKFTPNGSLNLQTINAEVSAQLMIGKEFYLDLSPAFVPEESKAE